MCPPISVIQGWIKYVLKAWAPSQYACLKLVSLLRSWLPSPLLKSGACSGLVFVKPVLISAQRVKLMLTWQRVCPKKCSGLQSILQQVLSCRLLLFKATMLNLNTKQEQLGFLIPTLKDILIWGSRQLWKFLHLELLNEVKTSRINIHAVQRCQLSAESSITTSVHARAQMNKSSPRSFPGESELADKQRLL